MKLIKRLKIMWDICGNEPKCWIPTLKHIKLKEKYNELKGKRKNTYEYLRQFGYSTTDSYKMRTWSKSRIREKLVEDQKI